MSPWAIIWAVGALGAVAVCLKDGAWQFAIGVLLVLGLIGIGIFAETMGFDPRKKKP
jgi:hypothetical protein